MSLASVSTLVKNDVIEKAKTSEVSEEEEDEKLYRSPKALNAIKCNNYETFFLSFFLISLIEKLFERFFAMHTLVDSNWRLG